MNGQLITTDEIRAATARRREEAEANGLILTPEERLNIREQAIDFLVDQKLLLQEARRLNLEPLADQELLVRSLVEHWMSEVPAPRISEVREFYRKNRDQFWIGERAWAAHIVKHTEGAEIPEKRAEVEHLRHRVLGGEVFADIAVKYSDCPENGGDLGYFPRGTMVAEFDEIIFSAPINTVTPVFQTTFGYHIAIVYDRKPEGIPSFDDVQPDVERLLLRHKQDRELGRHLTVLRSKAVIKQI